MKVSSWCGILQASSAFSWEALWGGVREPGDLGSLQFLMLVLTSRKRGSLSGGEWLPQALLTLLLRWRLSLRWVAAFPCICPETSPLPQFQTLYLFSREPFLLFLGLIPAALGWQEITEESCTNFSRLGNSFCGNQREQAPKIPKVKDEKAIDLKSYFTLNWAGTFIITVIYFNSVMI